MGKGGGKKSYHLQNKTRQVILKKLLIKNFDILNEFLSVRINIQRFH